MKYQSFLLCAGLWLVGGKNLQTPVNNCLYRLRKSIFYARQKNRALNYANCALGTTRGGRDERREDQEVKPQTSALTFEGGAFDVE